MIQFVQPQLWAETIFEVRPFVDYILMSSPVRYCVFNWPISVEIQDG